MVVVKNIILLNQKISIFKKNGLFYIYIYNKNFFLILKTNLLVGIKNSNEFLFFEKGTINRRLQGKQDLNSFLKQFYMYSYSKLKFTGKGYKIKKNKKCNMMLLFNRSHITNIFCLVRGLLLPCGEHKEYLFSFCFCPTALSLQFLSTGILLHRLCTIFSGQIYWKYR